MVCGALSKAGFETREADDAESALNMVGDRLPDLVLLDWMLPGQNGVDFARRLKREDDTREVPIVILTAKGEEHDKLLGFAAGWLNFPGVADR